MARPKGLAEKKKRVRFEAFLNEYRSNEILKTAYKLAIEKEDRQMLSKLLDKVLPNLSHNENHNHEHNEDYEKIINDILEKAKELTKVD